MCVLQEVEALFKSEKCPQVISVEFAHNNNWYITFQSDTDAQQVQRAHTLKHTRLTVMCLLCNPCAPRFPAGLQVFAGGSEDVSGQTHNGEFRSVGEGLGGGL